MVDLARGIVVCRRVRRREPFSNLLFYLEPYGRVSGFIMQGMILFYEHFISSMLFTMTSLAFLASGRRMVQCKVGKWTNGLRTVFEVISSLHSLSNGHPDLLLYQAV